MFQFTHPGRGATCICCIAISSVIVSIHAPREGCDAPKSTGATDYLVSIHAPREGCDLRLSYLVMSNPSFNSRTPGGVRQIPSLTSFLIIPFQFTHPGRGATPIRTPSTVFGGRFNSRTPGGVRLARSSARLPDTQSFNSRTPGGVRQVNSHHNPKRQMFQFPHPGRGATFTTHTRQEHTSSFNSRTPGGVRLEPRPLPAIRPVFQFTHPGWGATWYAPGVYGS